MAPRGVREWIENNPFHVLGLSRAASRQEVEREGQKLLGLLELKVAAAAEYATPLGNFPRTPEKVREAMAELRIPDRRLFHELGARLPATERVAPPEERGGPTAQRTRAVFGYGGPVR